MAPRFRQRLLALFDALLEVPGGARGGRDELRGTFLLDGQAITLRDYLSVRPTRAALVQQALQSGAIEAGPWYVLGDNLIPSGEALVRNLEAGRRVLAEFGATPPSVAYCPDTFGHPAALPLLARGFGLRVGVVWRGAGGSQHPSGDTFWWNGPGGERLLTYHLPPDGYEYGSALPKDEAGAADRWARLAPLWRASNRTGIVLLLNGADHHARQPDIDEAVAAIAEAAGATVAVQRTSLDDWASAFVQKASAVELPTVAGELRDSYGYTWTLGGTLGTRAAQKRSNARLERGLLRDVEPWLALIRLHDRDGTANLVSDAARLTMAQLPALLARAWEDLLATHPHDTLCGCSIDTVARAMDVQQEMVAAQGVGLREAALQLALAHDPSAARNHYDFDWRRVVVRNRASRRRGGVATLRLRETLQDVPVGPSGTAVQPTPNNSEQPRLHTGVWASQPIAQHTRFLRRESPQHYPDNDLIREETWLAWIPPVPANGVVAYDSHSFGAHASKPVTPVRVSEAHDAITIDNGRLRLVLRHAPEPLLSLQVEDRLLPSVLSLETQADVGDSYTPALRGPVERLQCVRATIVQRGPLRATVRLFWRTAPRVQATGAHGRITVITHVSVDADATVLRCNVYGNVWRTDQRLQLVWHTDVEGGAVWADAAFGPIRRVVPVAPPTSREQVIRTMPMHRWAMHANPMFGATMIADGLAEAQVQDARLALTLVRGIGELSRGELPERPGHAGWPSSTPDAQSLGSFRARSALFLHGPMSDDVLSRVRDACDDVLLPLVGESWRDLDTARLPAQLGGASLQGEAFEASAITISQQDERAMILRAVNMTARAAHGAWQLPDDGPWLVTRCEFDETPLEPSQTSGAVIPLDAGPREVITIRVRRAP